MRVSRQGLAMVGEQPQEPAIAATAPPQAPVATA
jgi:hypothetical protein